MKRLFRGGWFWGAVFLTFASLWAGIGSNLIRIMRNEQWSFGWVAEETLVSSASVITLPVFAALPCAAFVWNEMHCGAVRPVVFRCGVRIWRMSKMVAVMVSAAVGQGIALAAFCSVVKGVPSAGMLFSRLFLTLFYAWLGAASAIWCRDGVIGCLVPVVFSFACQLFGGRFFPDIVWLQPGNWMNGRCLWVGVLLAGLGFIAFDCTLRKETSRYV